MSGIDLSNIWTQLSFLFTALAGFLVGVLIPSVTFLKELHKEREEDQLSVKHERDRYFSRTQDNYFRFLELVVQYPDLGVYSSEPDRTDLSPADQVRRAALYDMLFAIFEAVYRDSRETPELWVNSWPGWRAHLADYLRKPSFRDYWLQNTVGSETGFGLDRDFEKFVDDILAGMRDDQASA
jgi:hypothetical protein